MAQIVFTPNLKRHIDVDVVAARGDTVGKLLEDVFRQQPNLRGYILDDQGGVRKHVNIYVNGRTITDRVHLSDPVDAQSELFVAQALSGG
ncbi:MAG: MoaD/ThiS family protein [Gammaproteobacteria bacterium]|nr:MoaD/ThiS family protein [Gammaproteobacteria bacterium]